MDIDIGRELWKSLLAVSEVRIENPSEVLVFELHRTKGKITPLEMMAKFDKEAECVIEGATMVCREKVKEVV
jgi:hypothetical protein